VPDGALHPPMLLFYGLFSCCCCRLVLWVSVSLFLYGLCQLWRQFCVCLPPVASIRPPLVPTLLRQFSSRFVAIVVSLWGYGKGWGFFQTWWPLLYLILPLYLAASFLGAYDKNLWGCVIHLTRSLLIYIYLHRVDCFEVYYWVDQPF